MIMGNTEPATGFCTEEKQILQDFYSAFQSPPTVEDKRRVVWQRKRALNKFYNLLHGRVFSPFIKQAQKKDINDIGDLADREQAVDKFTDKFLCTSTEQPIPYFFDRFDLNSGVSWTTWVFRQLKSLKIDAYRQRTHSRSTSSLPAQQAQLSPAELTVWEFKQQTKKVPLRYDVPLKVNGEEVDWEIADTTQPQSMFDRLELQTAQDWKLALEEYINTDPDRRLVESFSPKHPQCNSQILAQMRAICDPSATYEAIAQAVASPRKTVEMHYRDRTLPLLKEIAQDLATQCLFELHMLDREMSWERKQRLKKAARSEVI